MAESPGAALATWRRGAAAFARQDPRADSDQTSLEQPGELYLEAADHADQQLPADDRVASLIAANRFTDFYG